MTKQRIVASLLTLTLLAVVLPPLINVGRFRGRIAAGISRAVGRPVNVGRVTLRLLPQPGFNLQKFEIVDDPAFSAEPMLRADEVTAALRLSSLWRGRLEIARLNLNGASLNLVHNPAGVWNLEELLAHSARIPTAPTANQRAQAAPRFPYIEVVDGRINFKSGPEKKVFALTSADFALWLGPENEWGFRLKARPMRTDTNISDTGLLRLSGAFQRSPAVRATPLRVLMSVERAQLGQLTKLLYGRDRGWRGAVELSAMVAGTPAELVLTGDAEVRDFRRYDIAGGEVLRLRLHCAARYTSVGDVLQDILCQAPVGGGSVAVRGRISHVLTSRDYQLNAAAENVPMNALVSLARHAKKNLADDLIATGSVDAAFTVASSARQGPPEWAGGGSTSSFRLSSKTADTELRLPPVQFVFERSGILRTAPGRKPPQNPVTPSYTLAVNPFAVPLGAVAPAIVQANFSASGYALNTRGDAQLERLIPIAKMLGMPVPASLKSGAARLNLQIAGRWREFAPAELAGTLELRNVTAELPGIASPLQIASASLNYSRGDVLVSGLAASFAGSAMNFSGWVQSPQRCETAEQCLVRFDLRADELSPGEVNRLLNSELRPRPWYQLVQPGQSRNYDQSWWLKLRAIGTFSAQRLRINSISAAANASSKVSLQDGHLRLTDFVCDLLGGRHIGEWRADFSTGTPSYSGEGRVERVSAAELAEAMHDDWATGTVNGKYRITFSGKSLTEMIAMAAGSLDFDLRNGMLRQMAPPSGDGPLHVQRFFGRMALRQGAFSIPQSRLETSTGIYTVTGTASLSQKIDFTLRDRAHTYSVRGTLSDPRVSALPMIEQAAADK